MSYGNGANYATTDGQILCRTCKHGQILESSQGHTVIRCHYTADGGGYSSVIPFMVTKCDRHERNEVGRIWDTAQNIRMDDGHCWIHQWVDGWGQRWVRADTMNERMKYVMGVKDPIDSYVRRVSDED